MFVNWVQVPVKFSCVVRVVSVFRCRGKEIKGMRLTLEDPTARLHANLLGENAVTKDFTIAH